MERLTTLKSKLLAAEKALLDFVKTKHPRWSMLESSKDLPKDDEAE